MNEDIQDQDQPSVEDEPRYNKRLRLEKSFSPYFLTYLLESEPQSFKEVMNSSECPFWKEAIKSKIDSIL